MDEKRYKVQQIAAGEAFDIADAIRLLADVILNHSAQPTPLATPETPTGPGWKLQKLFGRRIAETLIKAGYTTPDQLRKATDAELLALEAIGPATVLAIREKLRQPAEG